MSNTNNTYHIHEAFRKMLDVALTGKFEVAVALVFEIIRTDYKKIDDVNSIPFRNELASKIKENMISIYINPLTPIKIYQQILKDIYTLYKMNGQIKDTRELSKENKLRALFEINNIINYIDIGMSDVNLNTTLPTLLSLERGKLFSDTKEINRLKKMINEIKKHKMNINMEDYLY